MKPRIGTIVVGIVCLRSGPRFSARYDTWQATASQSASSSAAGGDAGIGCQGGRAHLDASRRRSFEDRLLEPAIVGVGSNRAAEAG